VSRRHPIIAGLDLGSSTVRLVVGRVVHEEKQEDPQIHIIGAVEVSSEGIQKGAVTAIDDAVESISQAFDKAERLIGMPIEHVYVGVSGPYIMAQPSKGVIAVSRADGEILEGDIDRVIEAAQAVATPPNYEILHVIPRSFTVDHQAGIKDPIGMTGVRLEVDAQIILGLSSTIKNLTKAVYRTGRDIDDLVLSSLAAAEATLTKKQKELGVILVNIGAASTTYIVFEEGDVLTVGTIPIGSGHITADIAIGLRTSIDIAEELKREHGSALPGKVNKREEIALDNFGESEEGAAVSRRQLTEIIEARVEEIFEHIERALKTAERSALLPAGVVLIGSGAKLDGIVEVAKKTFRLPSSLGYPHDVTSALEKIHDPAFSVALGLVLWGYQLPEERSRMFIPNFSSVDQTLRSLRDKVKSWFF